MNARAPSLVEDLMQAMARHAPRTAIIDGHARLTYADLERASARFGGALRERGIGPGDLVCVYAGRGWHRCAAILAVWRLGGAVVCIDPAQPWARTARTLRACAPRLVIGGPVAGELDAAIAHVHFEQLAGPPIDGATDGPASYAIATSGSTGEPKCVLLPPAVLGNLGAWHRDHWRFDVPAHTLHTASVGFDVSQEELVVTLLAGAALVIADDHQRRDPYELFALIRANSVARVFQTPGGLYAMASVGSAEALLPSLREIVVAGEQLIVNDEVRRFCVANNLDVVNEYGPSETHVVTQQRLTGDPSAWPDRPPIGNSVAGAELFRVDNGVLRPFGPDDKAELAVAGGCVGLEYMGDPKLTEAKFRELPDASGRIRRCYLTGDLVRENDGRLEFVSRTDDQVKINGYRVEPGEIEAVLNRLPGLRRIAVLPYRQASATHLAACYVPQPGATLTEEALREYCAAALPDYMVPATFREFASFPLNTNGKVDRTALRESFDYPKMDS